jgi:glutathione S-transferase
MPMQKVMGDRLRPADKKNPYGVDEARAQIATALGVLDRDMAGKTWAMGDDFTLADCAAAPALFYANMVQPFGDSHKNVAAYLQRLMKRPSYARALKEAEPYFKMVPQER